MCIIIIIFKYSVLLGRKYWHIFRSIRLVFVLVLGCISVRKTQMLREGITVMFILWFTYSEKVKYLNPSRGSCDGKWPSYNYFELWDIWHSYTTPTSEIWHGMGWRPTLRSRKQPAHLYHVAWQQPIQTIQDPSPQSGRKLLMCVSSEGRNQ